MQYRVMYRADGWRPLAPKRPALGEWQVVHQDLDPQQRLYVELGRVPGAPIRVAVARLEVAIPGTARYRTVKQLRPEELELVELPAGASP